MASGPLLVLSHAIGVVYVVDKELYHRVSLVKAVTHQFDSPFSVECSCARMAGWPLHLRQFGFDRVVSQLGIPTFYTSFSGGGLNFPWTQSGFSSSSAPLLCN